MPLPINRFRSRKYIASDSVAGERAGKSIRLERISPRTARLPQAISPMTKGWVSTWFPSSSRARISSPRRRCSIHTEVSTRTIAGTTPWRGLQLGLASSQSGQAPRAFPLHQGLQGLPDQLRLRCDVCKGLRPGHKLVVDIQSRPHSPCSLFGCRVLKWSASNLTSTDAKNNAMRMGHCGRLSQYAGYGSFVRWLPVIAAEDGQSQGRRRPPDGAR